MTKTPMPPKATDLTAAPATNPEPKAKKTF